MLALAFIVVAACWFASGWYAHKAHRLTRKHRDPNVIDLTGARRRERRSR